MYLDIRDMETVLKLYDRCTKKEKIKPNSMLLNQAFAASLLKKDSDRIVEMLETLIETKIEPRKNLIKKLSYLKDLPDRIYVLMKENFGDYGVLVKNVRSFSYPSFREKSRGDIPMNINHKRFRIKKEQKQTQSKKTRKALSSL